jgi:hypothetical protein
MFLKKYSISSLTLKVFFTTLKTFIRYPGKLSADYCSGIRKKIFQAHPFFPDAGSSLFAISKVQGT